MKKQLLAVASALAFATVAQGIPELRLDIKEKTKSDQTAVVFEEIDDLMAVLNSKGLSLDDFLGKDSGGKEFDLDISKWKDGYAELLKLYKDKYPKPGGGDSPSKDPQSTHAVPDGGATAILLGTALAGLGIIRRYLHT